MDVPPSGAQASFSLPFSREQWLSWIARTDIPECRLLPGDHFSEWSDEEAVFGLHRLALEDRFDDGLLARLKQQADFFAGLAPRHMNLVFIFNRALLRIVEQARLQGEARTLAYQLALACLRHALTEPDCLWQADHVYRQILDIALAELAMVDSSDSPPLIQVRELQQAMNAEAVLDHDQVLALFDRFHQPISRYRAAMQKRLPRMVDSARGRARTEWARHESASMINRSVNDRPLPSLLIELLEGPVWQSLQFMALNQGPDGEGLKEARATLKELIWSVTTAITAEQKQRLYKIIEALPERLNALLVSLEHNPAKREYYVEAVEALQLEVIQGSLPEAVAMPPLAESHKQGAAVAGAEKYLDKYIVFEQQGEPMRCLIVGFMVEFNSYILLDAQGKRSNTVEAAWLMDELAARRAQVFDPINLWQRELQQALKGFGQIAQLQEKQRDMARQKAAEEAKRLAEAQEAARLAAEARAKQRAAEAAEKRRREAAAQAAAERAEAERVAHEQREAKARQEAEAAAEAARQREEIVAKLEQLQLGDWIELPGDNNSMQRAKLAVKLRSSDKYVFVDRVGLKLAEHTGDQLITLAQADQLRFLDKGVYFEDSLVKVVGGIRRKRD